MTGSRHPDTPPPRVPWAFARSTLRAMSDGIPGGPPRFGPPPAPAKPAPARGPEKKGQKPPPGAKAKAPEGQASSTVTADSFSRAVAGSATVQVKPSRSREGG